MSKQEHLIIPPIELVQQWALDKVYDERDWIYELHIAAQAAQWAADQELEACVDWLDRNSPVIGGFHLRIDRRPNPPSLKEQALLAIDTAVADDRLSAVVATVVRRALETLDD